MISAYDPADPLSWVCMTESEATRYVYIILSLLRQSDRQTYRPLVIP